MDGPREGGEEVQKEFTMKTTPGEVFDGLCTYTWVRGRNEVKRRIVNSGGFIRYIKRK